MPRSTVLPAALAGLLLAFAASFFASGAHAESGSPAELGRGQSVEREAPTVLRGTRSQLLRGLSRRHTAEIDSLEALAAVAPRGASALQAEIERAKHRHAREEIELQRQVAVRDGRVALARRLELRLTRLDGVARGDR